MDKPCGTGQGQAAVGDAGRENAEVTGAKVGCPQGEDPSRSCGLREKDAVSQVPQQEGARTPSLLPHALSSSAELPVEAEGRAGMVASKQGSPLTRERVEKADVSLEGRAGGRRGIIHQGELRKS